MVARQHEDDVRAIIAKRHDNGGDFWVTPDGRWGTGSPFSTFDRALMLSEPGLTRTLPVMKGAAKVLLGAWRDDGRFRSVPKGAIYPCHTANTARALCRLGYARDRRLKKTFEYPLETQHDDGGWRCNTVKLGRSAETDASNPGTTLAALDAFRFSPLLNTDGHLDGAASSLLAHWETRRPLGPCSFGIGTLFMNVEFPFLRYNLFLYVYILSLPQRTSGHQVDGFQNRQDPNKKIPENMPNRHAFFIPNLLESSPDPPPVDHCNKEERHQADHPSKIDWMRKETPTHR